MVRIGIAGAGRMGIAIADIIAATDDLEVTGIWTRSPEKVTSALVSSDAYIGDDLAKVVDASDVIIDFSLPDGTETLCKVLAGTPKPLVCGVSGLNPAQLDALKTLGESMPVVYDRNMSVGIAVMTRYVAETAAALGPEFRVSVDEVHHVHKKDAPSGTALKLGEAAAAARGQDFDDVMVYESEKSVDGGIEFRVERRGEVPGEHTVHFESPSEALNFSHSVTTRDVFARGAVRAACWVNDRPAGFFSMQDVLFGA